jgi:hypothetical protein
MTPILWFHDHGVGVFPLVPGTKKPMVSFPTYTCTREQAARFHNLYGVRLGRCRADWLAVVDSDSPETETWVAVNLIDTPFRVRTARGVHRYYRTAGPLPSYIHRDGLTIENRNEGLYVVGPGSVHPSGIVYTADGWSWRWEDIPFFPADFIFDDGSCGRFSTTGQPLVLPPAVCNGERHHTLHKIMRSLVAHGVPLEGAIATCRIENREKCAPSTTSAGGRFNCRRAKSAGRH